MNKIAPTRTVQFINDRLLLEYRDTDYGVRFYDLTEISVADKVHIAIAEEELEEINRIIANNFAIPERKKIEDDDIPF